MVYLDEGVADSFGLDDGVIAVFVDELFYAGSWIIHDSDVHFVGPSGDSLEGVFELVGSGWIAEVVLEGTLGCFVFHHVLDVITHLHYLLLLLFEIGLALLLLDHVVIEPVVVVANG